MGLKQQILPYPAMVALTLLALAQTGCGNSTGKVEWRHANTEAKTATKADAEYEPEIPPPQRQEITAVISTPRDGELIADDVYKGLTGTVANVPTGRELWIFARDDDFGNWFLQYPPATVNSRRGAFSQGNSRLATPGRWSFHVCEATAAASRRLHAAARAGQWVFTAVLPEGVTSLDSVDVERRN